MQFALLRAAPLAAVLTIGLLVVLSGCEVSQEGDAATDSEAIPETVAMVGGDGGAGLRLLLPTSNDALLRGDLPNFYMGLDMAIPGLRPEPWMGGRYGFVRNVAATPAGRVFTRVHQGIDIRPVYPSPGGAPLDTVRTIDSGVVVHANDNAGISSYGRYVVIEHRWDDSPVVTLHAHFDQLWVVEGQHISAGEPIGRMGYTGAGLPRHRAHLHLEVALLLNRHYQVWHDAFYGTPNHHGPYFGRNIMGVNPSELYLALHEEPDLTFSDFVQRQPVAYRLAIPGQYPLDLLSRYPWLTAEGVSPDDHSAPGAWVVSFTREGVPVLVDRQPEAVAAPQIVFLSADVSANYLSTAGFLTGGPDGYRLTRTGLAHAALLATTASGVPPWF